ncbi:MAG: response regulator [Dehalococcoidia bacterium]
MERFSAIRILLVEDSADDIEIMRRALGRCNVPTQMDVARDGQEALDYLFGREEYVAATVLPPDFILVDINLPRLNGIETLERIRACQDVAIATIPVIMLTASSRQADVIRAYRMGSNAYVSKPTDYEEFVDVISDLAEFWLTIAKLPRAA